MTNNLIVLVALIIGVLVFYFPRWRKRWLLSRPFPSGWLGIVQQKLPFYDRLELTEQQQLRDLIRLFIDDKKFFGCGGLEISDEIRITIAAEACLLLLNRKSGVYPDLRYILVYPHAFRTNREQRNVDGTISANKHGLLGESWSNGKVILSWDDVQKGASDFHDGHNVVLHEFSHQLDSEDGTVNGAPVMSSSNLKIWAKVFSTEFSALNEAVENHHKTVMDYYGATNPAEFFAVVTETYFEKPAMLERKHPELYLALSNYYRTDPKRWQ